MRALAAACEPLPGMTVTAVGVGAGSKDFAGWPNVVRVVLGEPAPAAHRPTNDHGDDRPTTDRPTTELAELMANVDDLDPRLWPDVIDALLAAGAADAWLVPIHMKKGRPAFTVHALANPAAHDAVVDALLARTTTLGVREVPVTRTVLDRSWRAVAVDGVRVQVKVGSRDGVIWQATPEFDSLVTAADALGIPLRTLATRVAAAQAEAGLVAGLPHR